MDNLPLPTLLSLTPIFSWAIPILFPVLVIVANILLFRSASRSKKVLYYLLLFGASASAFVHWSLYIPLKNIPSS